MKPLKGNVSSREKTKINQNPGHMLFVNEKCAVNSDGDCSSTTRVLKATTTSLPFKIITELKTKSTSSVPTTKTPHNFRKPLTTSRSTIEHRVIVESKEISNEGERHRLKIYATMGWGQPTSSGKRGRNSSEENRNGNVSECNANSENSPEEIKAFGKRPRDVSPLSGEENPQQNEGEQGLPDENRLMSKECSFPSKQNPGSSAMLLLRNEEYSKASVISESSNKMDAMAQSQESSSLEEHLVDLGQLKIRTSAPTMTKNGYQKSRRGPRFAAFKPKTAYPRRMSPTIKKLSSGLSNASSSGSTSTFSEEEAYEDLDSEEDEDDESESVTDDVSTATSVDIIPPDPENASPEIVPAIRPSYFPFVPPYINFCLHNQRTESLPREIQKHLKWRLSNITPVVVKKTLTNSGYRLLRKTVEWGGHWGRHMKAAMFKTSVKDFQKLNHLPGTFQLGRKDRLWRNIQRFMNKFGKEEFGFMPKTFVLPLETKNLKAAWESNDKGQLWIVKPPAGARGTGIRVVNRWHQVPKKKPVIVQSYIGNPYLINDRKFDLRLYVLVTNFHPLKVYLYNDGLVRFAPVKYSNDTKRAGDRFMHLTNYSINKNCELYTKNENADACEGHKWTLKTLWRHFVKEGKDVQQLWTQIEEIVIKTLICAEDPIVNSTTCYLPNLYNGYELFGFDIILDSDLKPWLLEVNISPSLHSSSPLDLAVKGPMIKELFNIVGYHLPPKLSPVVKTMFSNSLDVPLELETPVFDKRIYNNILSREEQAKHKSYKSKFEKRDEYLEEVLESLTPDDVRQLIVAEDELSQCYNFSRIYPTTTTHTYTPYFEMPRYYNMLFDAWETSYHNDRPQAVKRLIQLCRQKIHLQVPVNAGSMISESPVTEDESNNGNITQSWEVINESEKSNPTTEDAEPSLVENASETCSSDIQTDDKSKFPTIAQVPAVLDNITNSCSRSLSSSCPCNSNGVNKTAPSISPPGKVTDLPKGVCF